MSDAENTDPNDKIKNGSPATSEPAPIDPTQEPATMTDMERIEASIKRLEELTPKDVKELEERLWAKMDQSYKELGENITALMGKIGIRLDEIEDRLNKLEAPGDARDLGDLGDPVPVDTLQGDALQGLVDRLRGLATLDERLTRIEGKLKHL